MARILGLDLGSYSVKAVSLVTTLRGFQVGSYWEERVPPVAEGAALLDAQVQATGALMARLGFTPDSIVCGVPGTEVITRLLRLPFTDSRKIDQVVGFEVGEQLPFEVEDVVIDHQVVASDGQAADVLVAVMRRDRMAELLAKFKAIGVDPRVLCLDTLPLAALARDALSMETSTYAVVDVGHAHTSVSVVGAGSIQYVRTLTRGGKQLTEAISLLVEEQGEYESPEAWHGLREASQALKEQAGGWDFGALDGGSGTAARARALMEEALVPLVQDLRQTFQAHAAQKRGRVEKIFLCGGTSRLPFLAEFLSRSLGVEVAPLHVAKGSYAELAKPGVPMEILAKALALAARAVTPSRTPLMNLRRGEHSFKGDFQYLRGRIIQLSAGIALVLLLVGVYAWSRFYTLGQYEARQKARLAEVTKATLGVEVTEFSVAQNRLERGDTRASIGALLPQTTGFDYLLELSKNIGKEKLDVKRLEIGPKRISMEGEITSIGALDQVVQSLSGFKCFGKDAVRIIKSGKNQLNDKANFQLLITPSC